MESSTKTIEEFFIDWEATAFGFGYGTGERPVLAALKAFLELTNDKKASRADCYDYRELEDGLGATVAWLLINVLCRAGIIEYGSSPRYGWLTPQGIRLKAFVSSKTDDELYELCAHRGGEDYIACYPESCNCGPNGYQEGIKCPNPFWPGH